MLVRIYYSRHCITAILSEVLERPIRYTRPSPVRFMLRSINKGKPFKFALVQTGIYLAAALVKADRTTDDFENLMGRKPGDFRGFASAAKEIWLGE